MNIVSVKHLRRGLILFIVAVLLLTACNHTQPIATDRNVSGNSSENINHWGYVALQGNQMYYYLQSNWQIREGLYASTQEGKNTKRLDKGRISSINAVGDWIYYVKAERHTDYPNTNIDRYVLYKIAVDGSNKTKLIEDCGFVFITDNTLFYSVYTDREMYAENGIENPLSGRLGNIYKADINDLEAKSALVKEDATSYIVEGHFLYYLTDYLEAGCTLRKYDLSTSEDSAVIRAPIYDFTVKDDMVYYIDATDLNIVKTYSQSTGDSRTIYTGEKQLKNICVSQTDIFIQESVNNVLKINLENPNSITGIGEADNIYLFDNSLYLWSRGQRIKGPW